MVGHPIHNARSAPGRLWATYIAPMGPVGANWREGAALACAGEDIIYAASRRGRVAALDAATGKIKWEVKVRGIKIVKKEDPPEWALEYKKKEKKKFKWLKRKEKTKSRISKPMPYGAAADENGVYLGFDDGTFRSFAAADGKERWRMNLKSAVVSAPTLWEGLVYFIAGDDTLYAVDAQTGKWKWQYKRETRKRMTIMGLPRPVINGRTVFFGASDGVVAALDALTGELLWGKRPEANRRRFEDIDSTPSVTKDLVFLATYDGYVFAIDRSSGQVKWSFEQGSIEPIAMAGDLVIVSGQDNRIHALKASTGQEVWKATCHKAKSSLSGAVSLGNRVIFGSSWGKLVILDANDGKKLARFRTWGGITGSPLIVGGKVFVIDGRGQVEAFALD